LITFIILIQGFPINIGIERQLESRP